MVAQATSIPIVFFMPPFPIVWCFAILGVAIA
ncbi:hypothetical protein FBZ89_10164 [Nitrospirillum amazonense]|uniref:Uncharacterized protein n=1 Tax=Nitrospirillum amazonense TaxID=28077 RepID=A0A560FS55_9PROT|nr:hypothetical protein FBZ89_10164 [Nitrospirillum amazonense]